jgi:polysaccharide export outer membrane protein
MPVAQPPESRRSTGRARPLSRRAAPLAHLVALAAVSVVSAAARAQEAAPRVLEPPAGDSAATAAQRAVLVGIGVGDRVRVKVWREPALSDEVTVDERGDVTLPRIGTVRVVGQSIAVVQDSLRFRFAEYLRNPSVAVTVFRRVGVQGEVRAPNLYFVDATMTLREVLAQAGGITELGNPKDVRIVREGQTMRLGRDRTAGLAAADLRSGDQVLVGRTSWLSRNALAVVSTMGFVITVAVQVLNNARRG